MKRTAFALVCVASSLVAAAASAMKGSVKDGVYHSPVSNFSIALPNFMGLQVRDAQDGDSGRVSISGTGSLWAVSWERVPADSLAIFAEPSSRDAAYRAFVADEAMPSMFRKASSQAAVVKDELLEVGGTPAYFAVVNLPSKPKRGDPPGHGDSIRGLLVFFKGEFIYMLECEMKSFFEEVNATALTDKQLAGAKATLERIRSSITFR